MNPKIDSVVKSNDGHHATISGPIDWDTDETSATFAATIGQMGQNGQIVSRPGRTPPCSRGRTTNAGKRRSPR